MRSTFRGGSIKFERTHAHHTSPEGDTSTSTLVTKPNFASHFEDFHVQIAYHTIRLEPESANIQASDLTSICLCGCQGRSNKLFDLFLFHSLADINNRVG